MKKILIIVFAVCFILSGCQRKNADSDASSDTGALRQSGTEDTFEMEDDDIYYLPYPETPSSGFVFPWIDCESVRQLYDYYQSGQMVEQASFLSFPGDSEKGMPILHPDKVVGFVFPEFVEDCDYPLVPQEDAHVKWYGEYYSYEYGGWFFAQIHTKNSFDQKYNSLLKGSKLYRAKDIVEENRFFDEESQTGVLTLEFSQGDGEVIFFYDIPDQSRAVRVIEIHDWDPKSEDCDELSELMALKGAYFKEQHVFYAYEAGNRMILSLKAYKHKFLSQPQNLLKVDIVPFE